jgi:DNA-binding PadR family transcriptional regulator
MNDLLILALLLEGPQHGYALKKRAGLIYGQEELHSNIVYPLLRKFVDAGWVTKREASGERGQTRTVYSLTAAGRRTIEERVKDFSEEEARSAGNFRLRVGLFSILDAASRERILDARKAYLVEQARRFEGIAQRIEFEVYSGEVVRWIREEIERELEWIGRLRQIARTSEKSKASRGGRSKR